MCLFLRMSGMNARERDVGGGFRRLPRGWTYQLVKRNMWVYSVDNGPMAQSLMDTGQVTWLREDGFKFRPTRSNISGWYAIWLKNRRKLRH